MKPLFLNIFSSGLLFCAALSYGYAQPNADQKPSNTVQNKPGGALSKHIKSASLLRVTPKTQDDELLLDLATGHSFFANPWIKPPTATTARDGLGPLFNARNCIKCHQGGGRGRAPDEGKAMRQMLVRLSVPGTDSKRGVIPEPQYGTQLQIFGFHRGKNGIESYQGGGKERAIGEAKVTVSYQQISGQYPDGQAYTLQKPIFTINNLSYGKFAAGVLTSPRIGPSLIGVGFIERIPEKDILALADADDKNKDGISGRANQVWSREHNKTMLGRYGLKANTPTLAQQVADAFVNDLGITSSIFPDENCGEKQTSCLKAENGRGPSSANEIDNALLASVTNFVRYFPVPYSGSDKKVVSEGKIHFEQSGCQSCHHASFITEASTEHELLSSQTISPYSDFLLHDMGIGLADGRPDFQASGNEWRTAPLWGIAWRQYQGKFNNYLHDGRAASVEQAILWHGGEAEAAKQHFMQLKHDQRAALITFIKSL